MSKKKTKKFRQDRKLWFRIFKTILKIRYRKPNFIYLGDKPTSQSIILSNHIGARVPLTLELYADFPIRFWGTHEMNTGLRNMYRYQTKTYYHGKKGWNIHLARLFCLLASPLTNIFYKGLRLISTYQDYRLRSTIQESLEVIQNGGNIVVFPEDSSEGYLDEMKSFYAGFAIKETKLIGYGRIIERGTVPEFFGVTYLTCSKDELQEQFDIKNKERKIGFVDDLIFVPLNELDEFIEKNKADISLQLLIYKEML
jgi:hypothetical protein